MKKGIIEESTIIYNIKDKTILVTGANRGIGKTLVESFIEQGAAKVYAAVRSLESASPLVEKYGDKVVAIHMDLADQRSISAAARTANDAQVVVNNAGVLEPSSPLDDNAIASLELEMNVNVYGLIRVAQAFAPVLKANGGGVFVQINSMVSMQSVSSISTYCASKAASYSITLVLREMLGKQGTMVLSVHPGPIATDMIEKAGFGEFAEPTSVVAAGIMEALKVGDFHVFPDSIAKQVGDAYKNFAENVLLADC